ncbi:unnamed protein product [Ixodes persulcatus]
MFSRKTRQIDNGKEATAARQATDTQESCTVGKQCIDQTEKTTERQCVNMNSNVSLLFFSSWTRSGTPIYILLGNIAAQQLQQKTTVYRKIFFFSNILWAREIPLADLTRRGKFACQLLQKNKKYIYPNLIFRVCTTRTNHLIIGGILV